MRNTALSLAEWGTPVLEVAKRSPRQVQAVSPQHGSNSCSLGFPGFKPPPVMPSVCPFSTCSSLSAWNGSLSPEQS